MSKTNLDAVERKYIVSALDEMVLEYGHRMKAEEKLLVNRLIKKVRSGIRYDKRTVKTESNSKS